MQWGNDILDWLASDDGQRILLGAIIPAVAIIVAGIVAALIGRGSTKKVIAQYQRDALTAAVQGLVLAGRKAASWNSISTIERVQVDHLIGEAETRIRLLAVPGAALAANWSAHQLEDMKRNSAGFSFQAQQTLAEYRDRLIAWNERPRQAKKLFGADLERWKYEADPAEQQLLAEQAKWEAGHTASEHEKSVSAPAPAAAAAAPTVASTAAPAAETSQSFAPPPPPTSAAAPPALAPTATAALAAEPTVASELEIAQETAPETPIPRTPAVEAAPAAEPAPVTGPSITPPPAVVPPASTPWATAPRAADSTGSPVSPGTGDEAPPPLSANQVRDRIDPVED